MDRLQESRVVPLLQPTSVEAGVALVHALAAAGIRCVEIALRTPAAIETIAAASAIEDMLVGAGTVRSRVDVDACVAAGARFIVSPGLDPTVTRYAIDQRLPVIPGTSSATEIQAASRLGLQHVKFFPATLSGGPPMIRALSAPFPEMRFLASGGIGVGQIGDYLAIDSVFAVGGSWIPEGPAADASRAAAEVLSAANRA